MVLDPWKIEAETDILETCLENVNVVLNCNSAKDIDVDNGKYREEEHGWMTLFYTELSELKLQHF